MLVACLVPAAGKVTCEDSPTGECSKMASRGFCEYAKQRMHRLCPATCNFCNSAPQCRRVNKTALVSDPHGIRTTADRMLRDYPELGPTALSHDPPVIKFDSFVSAQEAARIIAVCEPRLSPQPLVGANDLRHRVASMCTCDFAACVENSTVNTLFARILAVTNSPAANTEHIQIVRYTPGGYFRSHHDMAGLPHVPQGSRLWSVLVYLSAPDKGGGTRFTDLGISVQPALGTAIVWPSMSDADPSVPELRSHHEGLHVTAGTKWILNLRINQHSYFGPLIRGCRYDKQPKFSIEYLHNSLPFYHAARHAAGMAAAPVPLCDGVAFEGLTSHRPRLVMYDRLGSACDARPSYCCLVGFARNAYKSGASTVDSELKNEIQAPVRKWLHPYEITSEPEHTPQQAVMTAAAAAEDRQEGIAHREEWMHFSYDITSEPGYTPPQQEVVVAADDDDEDGQEPQEAAATRDESTFAAKPSPEGFGFVTGDTFGNETDAWEVSPQAAGRKVASARNEGLPDDEPYTMQAALVDDHWHFNLV